MMEDEKYSPDTESEDVTPEVSEADEVFDKSILPEETDSKEEEVALKPPKTYGMGTVIAGFIFFAITVCVFALYEYFAITFLYMPFANEVENIGEAIAVIFGYTFGLIITIIFGVAQLPENIISIILFKRMRRGADTKGKRIAYTVFYALSIVMLIVMLLTIGVFFGIIGTNS